MKITRTPKLTYTHKSNFMKSLFKSIAVASCLLLSGFANAQITGVNTVPGTFATIEAAVTALNAFGVGSGGATINVAAGHTETPAGPLVLTIAANSPSATNPLVIQKSGVGANPLITAFTPGVSTTLDGIFVLNGVDYVTIDGIDLQENAANTTATMQMEWGYALVKTAATNGASYNTIKNSSVTLNKSNTASVGIYLGNHTSSVTTALIISSVGGTSSYNKFYNNSVTNSYVGISITGYASAAPYDFYDQGNQVGVDGVSTRRNQVTNYGGAATTANGVFATNQNGLKIFRTYVNIAGGAPSTGTVNGINTVTGTNSNVDIYNDTVIVSSASAAGSTMIAINNSMGGTGAGNTINIYNNVVDGCTYATNTSGTFRGIASTATGSYTNMYNNTVSNNSIPGTGEFSGIYYGGSSVNICLNVNLNNNVISGNTKTGTSGVFYMLYASSSVVSMNCFANQMFNNNCSANTGGFYGYYNFAFALNENVYNNQIYNNTGGSGETVMLYVRSGSGPTNKQVYDNLIYNITVNTTTNFGAIWVDYGTISNVYRNTIYNLTNNTTTGGTPAVFGIWAGQNVNTQTTVYNNFISELKAPSASNVSAVYGIYLSGNGTNTSVLNAYYNTVYLNASSSGGNFGTTAVFCQTTTLSTDLRNNIFVNVSIANGTGTTKAIQRSSTSNTTYALTSGYNCLYAGTPGPTNLIFFDGTNSDQTLQAFKNRIGSREQASFSSLPPFINVAVSPYNLHLQNSVATQCESGGKAIAGYATDFDLTTRGATPDVGADEITGITVDIASPDIQYTPLTNSSVAPNRSCTNFATITDPSGINTTIGTRPRMYYKRSTNANTYNTNTNATDGWKYVEASNTSSPFSFTIDYSLLFGGGVVAGDVIQYFVVAQDLNGTPIVGINNGGFTVQPSSVALAAANFPLNNTINQYTIVNAALSGSVNVGPAELVTSLTNAGGIFQIINASSLSGNLTINITGDLTAETGTFALNQWAEEGVGGYTVSIVSSAAVVRNIYGSNAAASLIRFDGADRVNIDGRFASTGQYLMFRNTSNAAPTIGFLNDAQNNTVQYCIIESGNTSTTTTLGGAVHIGTTTGMNGNDNITISNCDIRDRSDITGNPTFGINCVGTNGVLSQYNDNVTISNNTIHDWYLLNGTTQYAISIGTGNSGFTISGNSFYQTTTRTHTVSGAVTRAINISFTAPVNSNGGHTISGNFIGGTAPGATGGDMTLTVSGVGVSQTFGGINMTTGLIPNSIQGNVIRKIDFTTNTPTAAATVWFGFSFAQGYFNAGTVSGNTIGDPTLTGSIKITINAGGAVSSFLAGFLCAGTNSSFNLQNNTIAGITTSGTTVTGALIPQWIQLQGTPAVATVITGNTIGSTTIANSIQNNATAAPQIGFSIRHLINTGVAATITNNTIQNVTDNSTNASSADYGILMIGSVGTSGTFSISNNTIRDNTMAGGATTPVLGHMGISVQGYAGTTHSISNNLIAGISCSNTGSTQNYAVGIQVQGSSLGGTMSANRIFDIRNSNTGAAPGIVGMYFSAGLNWTLNNNMVSLTNGSNTNYVEMFGVGDVMGTNAMMTLNYNSIYVGGSASSGAGNTAAYTRFSNSTVTMKNNLFYNKRTGGTGSHVAIANVPAAPASGWGANTSNYNAFVVSDTTKVGIWGVTAYNMSGWRTQSVGDVMSIWETSTTVSSAALFVNANNANLHINTSTYPEALGTPIAGVTVDYDGNARSATFPTIGADELACSNIVFTTTSQTNATCNGATNGSATVGGTGGNGITYSWAPTGGTAATATGLAAGTYTVTITNICGNSGTVAVTITQPAVVGATMTSASVNCNGGNDGTATAAGTGGTGPYTYSWSSGGTAATETGLAIGSYTVTITDANACTGTQTVSITQPTVLAATSMQTNVSCNGGSNGDAMVMVSGGTPSYTYLWAPSGGTNATASGLTQGTYTVTTTDANGCTRTDSFTLTEPTAITSTSAQTNPTCNGGTNGDAMVVVSGGTPGYTYMWAPSGGTAATATGLGAGTYTCTTTDAAGCTHTDTFTLTAPTALNAASAATNVSCFGGNNGDAMVSVSGGTPGYTYLWSTGGTAAMETGLIAGSYTVTTTDAAGCTRSDFFLITEPTALSAGTSTTNPTTCGGTNGAVDLTPVGGTGPYLFAWSNSAITEDLSGVASGSYSVTITDNNGCTTTATAVLNDPNAPAVTLSLPIDTVCQSTTAPFALTGETPAGGTFAGPGVAAGTFDPMLASIGMNTITYTYTDVNGCTGSTSDSLYVDICLDVPTIETAGFNVYPNPNNGEFVIDLFTTEAADVVVYDAIGQIVVAQQMQPGMQNKVSLNASGAYMVTVITANGDRTSKRVIVTK